MHPYSGHKQNAVGARRANKFMSGSEYKRADGGRTPAPSTPAFTPIRPTIEQLGVNTYNRELGRTKTGQFGANPYKDEGKASGGAVGKFARGGRTKAKPHIKIDIHNNKPQGGLPPPDLLAGAPGMPPPALLPPPGGALPPPGGGMRPPMPMPPPGAGAGPPGMRPPIMKSGGRVKMTAGSYSGVGRLQKAKAARGGR